MLSGVKIIDLTRYLPGPHATLRLADMGAEVIKIEEPGGDPGRRLAVVKADGMENSAMFLSQNRGKKGITANLKDSDDLKKVLNLVKDADVFVESFRPKVAAKLGLGYEALKKINPKIVYCSISGYGQDSPLSSLGGHDINYMALCGMLSQIKDNSGKPVKPAFSFADMIAGVALSEAVLYGLLHSKMHGESVYIDFSMTDSLLSIMGMQVMYRGLAGAEKENYVPVAYNIYETKDARFVTLGAIEPKFWENFCKAVGREDLIKQQFSPASDQNPAYLEVAAEFKKRDFQFWAGFASETDCCLMPVYEPGEMQEHPYVANRRMIQKKWNQMHTATRYIPSGSVLDSSFPPPYPGEYNNSIKK